ncbi:MAG: chromosomal replication initiator protein DnaA, partial [Clostridiales bacterium]|nr:chromosomal replication initiator protein DnaA [Candidatus Equinaster intestinalis]
GVVKKVQAYIQLDGKEPSIPALRNFIKDVITDVAPEPIKIETIIEEVARTYRVTDADILSNKKTSSIVLARQVAMYIAHEITNLTYEKIGESFGKDHSTVLYSVRKTEEYLKDKPYEKGIVDEIIRNIKE